MLDILQNWWRSFSLRVYSSYLPTVSPRSFSHKFLFLSPIHRKCNRLLCTPRLACATFLSVMSSPILASISVRCPAVLWLRHPVLIVIVLIIAWSFELPAAHFQLKGWSCALWHRLASSPVLYGLIQWCSSSIAIFSPLVARPKKQSLLLPHPPNWFLVTSLLSVLSGSSEEGLAWSCYPREHD